MIKFENQSIGSVYEYLKSTKQVGSFKEFTQKVDLNYTYASGNRNKIGAIGKGLGELLERTFSLIDMPVPPPPAGGNVALRSNGLDAGNHITMNDSPDYIEGYFTIKGVPPNDGAWLVNGHSMYPTISKGSRVILKRLENIDLIVFGEIYAVDLREHGGKIKRIKKGSDAGHWLLVSDNKEYEPFEVNVKADVLAVFRVICVVECF